MAKRLSLLVAMLSICFAPVWAQVTTNAQSITVQVSATQPWTDSGLDLQAGDVVQISTTASPGSQSGSGMQACDGKGVAAASGQMSALPLPSAPAGALLARLHASGTTPVFVGASNELHITDRSHLMLGMNLSGNPVCQGGLAVTLHVVSAGTVANSATDTKDKTRGEQLKSQLTSAAQIFMSGQFGMGKSETGASNATSSSGGSGGDATSAIAALKVSGVQLDAQLRKSLDSLPRRVNDQFKNLGDMVNFVIVGAQKDLQAALELATWHVADTGNQNAVINAMMQTYEKKDYLAMPMSTLFLFGRKQDFGYEMAEPIAMVASRHHFRIWKAPFNWNGQEVWVGAGTHDIGFAKDQRNNSVTHKIDPAVDGERDNIGSSLQKANKAKTLAYYLPPNPVQDAKNATGDGYHSDGKLLVIFLQ
jgi:hypothetical protein